MALAVGAAALSTGVGFAFGTIKAGFILSTFLSSVAINLVAQSLNKTSTKPNEAKGRTTMFRSSSAPRRVIYGQAMVSGPLVFAASSGADNRYLHLVIPLAGHQVESIDTVYFNDKPASDLDSFNIKHEVRISVQRNFSQTIIIDNVSFTGVGAIALAAAINADPLYDTVGPYGDSESDDQYIDIKSVSTGVTFTVTNAVNIKEIKNGEPFYSITKYLGDPNQLADQDLVDNVTEWTDDHRLRGVAYLVVKLRFNIKAWPTGIPNIKALVRGKNDIADPRTAQTGYTQNWALICSDYLRWKHGFNCDASEIDNASLIAAANVSDEQIEYELGQYQNRYEINGSFLFDVSPIDTLSHLQSAGAGVNVFQMGQWFIHAGASTAAEAVGLGVDDLRDSIKFQPKTKRQNLFNAVHGTFVDKSNHYEETDFPAITNAFYESQDKEQIVESISLPFTDDSFAAQRLAKIALEDHRQPMTIEFPAKIAGLRYAIWDVISLTIPQLGFNNKLFKVMDSTMNGIAGPDLLLKEYAPTVWSWNFGEATTFDPAPNTTLASPKNVKTPSNLMLFSNTPQLIRGNDGTIISRILADWHTQDAFSLTDEVQFKLSADTVWQTAGSTQDQRLLFGPVDDGALYDVRVRTFNSLNNVSDWLSLENHLVVGQKEAPADVDAFFVDRQPDGTREFSWAYNNPPVDLAGFVIKARLGSNWTWDDLQDMHTGVLVASPFETNQLAEGTYTIAIKAIDRKGNECSNELIVQSTLGPPRIKNALVIEKLIQDAWPGTKANCVIEAATGYLVPNSADTWATLPATWTQWTAWNMNPVPQMQYIHAVLDVGAVINFSPLVSITAQGVVTIEERHSNNNVAYSGWTATGDTITARYIQIRVTVDNPSAAGITAGQIILDADVVYQEDSDLNFATVGNGTVGDRRIPLTKTFNTITRVGLALQNVGAGWTWDIVDKNSINGPRIRIFNNGTLADATIDTEIKGA